VIKCGTLVTSVHYEQPWIFEVREDVVDLIPDKSRRCVVVDPDDSHLYKSLGCAAENIVHACAACGFARTLVTYDEVGGQN